MLTELRKSGTQYLLSLYKLPLLTILCLLLFLAACSTTQNLPAPETPREKLALADIAFQEVLSKYILNKALLTGGQRDIAKKAIASIDLALDVAKTYIDIDATEQFESKLTEIYEHISTIENIVKQFE